LLRRDELFAAALKLEDDGLPQAALERYRDLLAADPHDADAWHNQGLLLAKLGMLTEAEQSHRGYIAQFPDSWRAHSNLADVLLALERYEDALHEASRAADLIPGSFLPYFTAALAAAMTTRFDESLHWLERARGADAAGLERFIQSRAVAGALDRDFDPRSIYLTREFDRLEVCDWRNRDKYVEIFRELVDAPGRPLCAPPLVFRSFHLPLPLRTRRSLADNVARRFAEGALSLRAELQVKRRNERIRVGYVSSDFRTHPTAILGAPLFALHDRSRFEVHAFSLSLPDQDNPWYRSIRSHADHFHELAGRPLHEALSRVRAADIDILVDFNGPTTGALPELFAARAAPVQVSYLAFPGSSGAGLLDYLVCDRVCVPEDEEYAYGEKLVRLPQTFWICDPGEAINPLPARSAHGLAQDAIVFLAHHNSRKLYPEIFAVWLEILAAVPGSVLWLIKDHPSVRENLLREAGRRNVSADRLVFAARASHTGHRARIGLADVALDTPVCNGGTTTLDALAAGVPVISCSAPGFAGRMAASALLAAGLPELVLHDLDAYRRTAIALATDGARRGALRSKVAQARRDCALFDVKLRVRELEAAFIQMHERALRGHAPASFDVQAL
jgi:predicted O-linked N-acetylglucosamine transferase (SPINDLY family)